MFHTTTVLQVVVKEDWFMSIKLKDAYIDVLICREHKPFLRFSFLDQAYPSVVLPFEIPLAPHKFTRCM